MAGLTLPMGTPSMTNEHKELAMSVDMLLTSRIRYKQFFITADVVEELLEEEEEEERVVVPVPPKASLVQCRRTAQPPNEVVMTSFKNNSDKENLPRSILFTFHQQPCRLGFQLANKQTDVTCVNTGD
mmetsp:Transcript_25954/g.49225  ORF Transcript_25954/g.49225 Transcript_25954/m.49225 type:complete len:128 (-) Transcript_25954:53-436(-)